MRKRNERAEKFLGLMEELYGDTLSFPNLNYQNQRTKITVKCNIHDTEYAAWPTNLSRGKRGCPRCGKNLTREDFIEKARETHGDKYRYDKVEFVNTTTKVTVTCPEHGDWEVKPVAHYSRGTGCPKCALENNHLNVDSFIEKARAVHGNFYGYDKVSLSKNTDIVTIKCPHHGYFDQPARVHLAGHRCKECSLESNRSTLKEFIAKANEIHGDTYDYSKSEYVNNKTKLTVICKKHGEFLVKPNSHLSSKSGCPRCCESYGERELARHLELLNIKYRREFIIPGSRFRYDFCLTEFNTLIEFHGIQHYKPIDLFGGEEGHVDTLRRDLAKTLLAEEKGMPLIVLNHEDLAKNTLFDNLKNELIKLNIIS